MISTSTRPDPSSLVAESLRRASGPKALTKDADPIAWMENNFYLYDTGTLITFEECQRVPLREALRLDAEGKFVYNTVLWSWPKKSAKSSVIAAVALWRACTHPKSSIKLISNDLKQSETRVAFYIREAIKLNPALKSTTKINSSGYTIRFANGSHIESLPIDPTGEAGGNDDLLVFSELHGWKTVAQLKMWAEMTLSPTKYGRAQRWIDTYAGYSGESPILEHLYQVGVTEGVKLWPEWEVYANADAKLLATWVTRPMLPWQLGPNGEAYYREEQAHLTTSEYDRMHRNQWVSSAQTFVPAPWWHACRADLPKWDHFQECVVAVDAGVVDDCFAIVCLSRHDDRVALRAVKVWRPTRGHKNLFADPDNPENPEYPEGFLRQLADLYNVIAFGYDPSQMLNLAERLMADSVGFFVPFEQGKPRLLADKQLYDTIRDRRLVHSGEPELTEHVLNANSTADSKDTLRIIKRADNLKIDACVALSMGVALAYQYLPE